MRNRREGFTLIEIIVAMVIAGIVISLTLASWTFLSSRVATGKRTSEFRSQTEQTAFIIVNDLRTSRRVLSYGPNGVTFVGANGSDTITYALDGETLRKNGAAVPFVNEGAKIVRFTVEEDEAASAPANEPLSAVDDPRDVVLNVVLSMSDKTGLKSEISNIVKVRFAPPQNSPEGF